jgi:uncharacterized membrane protein YphA (DoxX/SURF4 family)
MKSVSSSCWTPADIVTLLARFGLGAMFVWVGLEKAMDPVAFLKLLRQYDLTQTPLLLNSIAALLPWFEVFCGLLLLLGVAVRGTALTMLLLLVPFTALVLRRALFLHSALEIPFCAVKFDCGCGGGEVFICRKLAENVLLMLLAGWLLAGRGRRLCVGYGLMDSGK